MSGHLSQFFRAEQRLIRENRVIFDRYVEEYEWRLKVEERLADALSRVDRLEQIAEQGYAA
jgi:hypothetical protein